MNMAMPRSLEPRPTEYRGILFRSKSEAVLARSLDILHFRWVYEPAMFAVGNWTPDFFFCVDVGSPPKPKAGLIEYKPHDVTDTYKDELADRYTALNAQYPRLHCCLLIGTPFEAHSTKLALLHLPEGGWFHFPLLLGLLLRFPEALRYRFDLKP